MSFLRLALRLCGAVLLLVTLAAPALAGQRLALVIGIDDYAALSDLQKARNDATAIAALLEREGFAATLLLDADRRAIGRAVSAVAARLGPGDEVLFYFAGHGVQIAGRNYLIPADAPAVGPEDEAFLTSESIAVDQVLETFQARGTRVAVLILDACRDNPFPRNATRAVGSGRGLAPANPTEGAFILYSAGSGQTALDRLGDGDANPNSVFTRTLLPLLAQPGRPLQDIARALRAEVEAQAARIGHDQRPAYYDELTGDYVLRAGAAPSPQAAAPDEPCTAARREWDGIAVEKDPALLRAFAVLHFACEPFRRAALDRAAMLERVAPQPQPQPQLQTRADPAPADPPAAGPTWRVRPDVSDGFLNLRSGPGTRHPVLMRLDAGTGGLRLGSCRAPDSGQSRLDWCQVALRGREGWVWSGGIERD
ncbi:caspase family protein [Gemmobacter caeruleus]|uniref:caspase family protein n=1 Tax=Gemmobacter caeruleus TaxID=2595004 RepID=UPI0011F02EA8|nr:caspase family protein [Gemmobacter caeruleus]